MPEGQRVDAGEGIQVDVVADTGVGFAQLHRGAELLGKNRLHRLAEDFDRRPVEQGGRLMVSGLGVTGSPKLMSS